MKKKENSQQSRLQNLLKHGNGADLPGVQGPNQASLLSNNHLRQELSSHLEASLSYRDGSERASYAITTRRINKSTEDFPPACSLPASCEAFDNALVVEMVEKANYSQQNFTAKQIQKTILNQFTYSSTKELAAAGFFCSQGQRKQNTSHMKQKVPSSFFLNSSCHRIPARIHQQNEMKGNLRSDNSTWLDIREVTSMILKQVMPQLLLAHVETQSPF
ncbi:U-box domain-containing protein kinase family protein [Striga asiatica]|uniref:U-box domain-containing protein kinase family protein n=1 Tax=Striga asiatica TaxID=4170 RepID=A0A5A7QE16_STRAF|nr:U-box domain-containing protein kinase family protein [Striga asiatica]